jgi:hypothetical protein
MLAVAGDHRTQTPSLQPGTLGPSLDGSEAVCPLLAYRGDQRIVASSFLLLLLLLFPSALLFAPAGASLVRLEARPAF